LELSSKPNPSSTEVEICTPAFEALRAMSYGANLAWSPDGQKLAFVAAIDGASSDVYLFDAGDFSVTRLTDEESNAASLHWSPDGSYLQYVTIDCFGTGAGFSMDGVWVYDMSASQAKLVEQSQNSGENFLAWQDDDTFYIYSWDALCTEFNLRAVDASQLKQDVLVDGCFTAIAYDPQGEMGLFAVTDFNAENCPCGKPMDAGLMTFGESVSLNGDNEHLRKFEYVIAYNIEFVPEGELFAIYADEGLQNIYNSSGAPVTIPNEVIGLKPYPAPQQEKVWAWSSYYSGKTGLWIVANQQAPMELSPLFSGAPAWSNDGQRLYFYESNRLLFAEAPQYEPTSFVEIPGAEITALVK
jgi:WD40 repeat protein